MPAAGPIRVARVVTRLNIGGPSIQAIELSARLTPRGFETRLIHGQVGRNEGDMRYLLERVDPRPRTSELRSLKRPIAPVSDANAVRQLFREFRAFKPHIVHTHLAKAGAVGRLAALMYNATAGRGPRARVVHTYHGHVLEGYFGTAATRMFISAERRLAAATDRIVAISPRIRDELAHQYRIGRPEQYRVVPLGFDLRALAAIDDGARAAARAALNIPRGAAVVTTVGRLTPIKDQMLFLEVARRVVRQYESSVFLIAGDGELRTPLEHAAAAASLGDRVKFLGWRRDLETVYGASDIFLLTSRNEGTPVALIESLAAGCAGVSTDVGGVSDVLPTADVGLLAPAGDADRLADHVAGLIAAPQRRRAMGEAGRRHVLAQFGIERLVADIEALYQDLVS